MRKTIATVATLAFALTAFSAGDVFAAQCKDAKGKFMKCPPPAAAKAATKCRDMKTKKFAKCGAAGTEPVPAK